MTEDLKSKFSDDVCENSCEENPIRREIENELVGQSVLVEKLSALMPKLEDRLDTILCGESPEKPCDKDGALLISTKLGNELHLNNGVILNSIERIKNIINRIEL